SSHSAKSRIEFRWSAGDSVLARSADSEPISTIWRQALETGTVAGSELASRCTLNEISRVVALPLIVAGDSHGVMVVGFQGDSATLATLERLEIRAGIASAVIALASGHQLRKRLLASSQFLLQNTSDPLFFLNAGGELTEASSAGKEFLAHSASSPAVHGIQQLSTACSANGLLCGLAHLFKPAESPRLSAWLDRIAELPPPSSRLDDNARPACGSASHSTEPSTVHSTSHPTSHPILAELHSGRHVQLHA